MKKKTVTEIICVLYIFLFSYAALSKLLDFQKFKTQLLQSPILTTTADLIVIGVPATEIIISLLLIFPRTRLTALYCAYILMTAFTAYIVAILNFTYYVPCSCGGILDKLGWTAHLVFNITFMLLAMIGILLQYDQRSVNSKPAYL